MTSVKISSHFFGILVCLALACTTSFAAQDDVRLESAQKWIEKGNYDKAVQEYRLYLSEHPDAAEIYAEIGKIRMQQGNYKLAADNYKVALKKKPSLLNVQEALAQVYEKNGDKDKAKLEWRKLIDLSQDPAQKNRAQKRFANIESPPYQGVAAEEDHAPPEAKTIPAKDNHPEPIKADVNKTPKSKELPKIKASEDPLPQAKPSANNQTIFDANLSAPQQTGVYASPEFANALQHYHANETDLAQKALRECLNKNPRHAGAFYVGGLIRFQEGDYAKALYNFKRSEAYPEKGKNVHYFLGRIYQNQKQKKAAESEYQKYLQVSTDENAKQQVQTWLQELHGNTNVTESIADKNEHITENTAVKKTAENEKAKDHREGENNAEEIKSETEQNAELKTELPSAKSQVAKLTLRIAHAKPVEGYLFYSVNDASKARGSLDQAVELYKQERFEKAINQFKQIILQFGGSEYADVAALDMATIYLQLGLNDNALAQTEELLKSLTPDSELNSQTQYLLALAHLQKKSWEKAERLLNGLKAKRSGGPSDENLEDRLVEVGELSQDIKKWVGYLEKSAQSATERHKKAKLWAKLGALHMRSANTEKGLEFFRKASNDCTDSALNIICSESQVQIADFEFKNKNWAEAKKEYQAIAKRDPRFKDGSWVHYQLANIYKETSNYEMALNEYKVVIDNYPYSYWAAQAKWQREDTIWRKQYEGIGN